MPKLRSTPEASVQSKGSLIWICGKVPPQKNNTIPRFCAVSLHPSLSRGSTSPSCCTVSPRVKVQQLKSQCLRQFINLVKRFSTCLTRLGGTDFGRILKQLWSKIIFLFRKDWRISKNDLLNFCQNFPPFWRSWFWWKVAQFTLVHLPGLCLITLRWDCIVLMMKVLQTSSCVV